MTQNLQGTLHAGARRNSRLSATAQVRIIKIRQTVRGRTANSGQGNAANGAAQNGASQGGTQPQPARTLTPAGSAQKVSTPVNINTATAEELQTLPRIGPAMAQRIIAWREAHGGFRSVDELDAVPGIGPSMLENLRPLVTV